MGNLSKKMTIVKWFVQFFLGFLLGAFTGVAAMMCKLIDIMSLDYIESGKEEGVKLFTITLVGQILGVVLGDLSLYKGQKFSILAVITAFFFGLVGYFFCFSQNSVVLWIITRISSPPVLITIISIITYNAVSLLHRKHLAKRKPKDGHEATHCGHEVYKVTSDKCRECGRKIRENERACIVDGELVCSECEQKQ